MARKKMMYNKGGAKKKQMGGVQSPRSVDSFIEPPVEQPFANQGMVQTPKNSFIAAKGGVRKLKQDQRKERKLKRIIDRKADKQAIKTLKQSSRKTRRDKPFKAGAGPIVEMTRSEKRADRRATNEASRIFRKQERKSRRIVNKADRIEDKGERQALKKSNKQKKLDAVNKKLNILNQSESSSVKIKPFIGPKNKVVKDKVVKDKVVKKGKSMDDMTFSEAYRAQRDANKKAGISNYGDDKGYFTWKGKEYSAESKSEKTKRLGTKTSKFGSKDNPSVSMPHTRDAEEGKYYQHPETGIKYQFKNGKYVPVSAEDKTKHDAAVKNINTKKNKIKNADLYVNANLASVEKPKSTISSSSKKKTIHQQSIDISGVTGYIGKNRRGGYKRRGGKR